ncbi:hypothetical protein sos41_15770 [Alphaproteobacteria bacterium SO-S41]|nr:hypothetical protein sos41_15770 [Alphaproteobacteria bacterium SO-S41]
MPFKGSCHCGAVAYEIDNLATPIGHCFCVTCRKTHAAASKPNARVKVDALRWLRGEELLTGYRSSAEKTRRFCSRCGSHVIAHRDGQDSYTLSVATLDDDPGLRSAGAIWLSEAAPWCEDDLSKPRFAETPLAL